MSRAVIAALIALCLSVPVTADPTRRLDNLETLARVWERIYLFHPRVLNEGLDMERALADAIPIAEAAANDNSLIESIASTLLEPLRDPAIRVFSRNDLPTARASAIEARVIAPGIGLIAVRDPDLTADPRFLEKLAGVYRGLGEVQRIVVDLRWPDATASPDANESAILRFFLPKPATEGSTVQRHHEGWSERQDPNVYRQNWIVRGGATVFPITQRSLFERSFTDTNLESLPLITTPAVFVINNHSQFSLSSFLDLLQRETGAAVVWEKRGATPRSQWIDTVPLGTNYEIYIPDSMFINASGGLGFSADWEQDEEIEPADLPRLARDLLPTSRSKTPFDFAMRFPNAAAVSQSISREQRIAALIKVWAIVNRFNPHLELAGAEWNRVLHDGIKAVENAQNARDYYLEIRRLTATLNDSHVTISHPSLIAGRATIPVELRPVEGRVFVSRVGEGVAADIKAGDEIAAVDGRTVAQIEEAERPRISLSTPGTLPRNLWTRHRALLGAPGTETRVAIERGGTRRDVKLTRRENPKFSELPKFRRIEPALGYIDLPALANVEELDQVLREMGDTSGLILDLRGYPKFFITPELTSRLVLEPVRSARFVTPIVSLADPLNETWYTQQYRVVPHESIRYTKPILVLINENTQSMAEDLCIFLRNAGRATFVGSQTAGTNGNIATIDLPGGGRMTFTGMRVFYDDGSRFQNIGIVPDIEVRPTVAGVRAGRDEVLEKAIDVLKGR